MRNFTCLGFNLSLVGNIKYGLFDLHKRVQKAFYQLKNQLGDMFHREPVLAIKLFDALVKPILLYRSNFWGCYDNIFSLSNSTERLNISLCKHLLGVKRQTSNVASLLEMGRYPLYIDATKQCIKNWLRINNGEVNEILACITDSQSSNVDYTWTSQIKQFLSKYGFGYLWLQKPNDKNSFKNILSKIVIRLKDCTSQEFFSTLKSQSKLRTYSKYKLIYEMEPYVLNSNFKQRQAVSKLRISDHKLQIELGRYHSSSLELSERTCPFCPNKIEDEYHVITECPMYNDERQRVKTTLSLTQTSDHQFFTNIFNCHKEFMKQISCFILEITDKRTEALELTEIAIIAIIPVWLFL